VKKSSVYLPDDLKSALAAAAARAGRSEADIIRLALERFVRAPGPAASADPRSRRPVPSGPCLVGVGVGPGDPELLTGRARRILLAADRVLAGSVSDDAVGRAEAAVYAAVPGVPVERLVLHVGPQVRTRRRTLAAAAERVAAYLDRGELVVFVTLGDPHVYSAFPALADGVRGLRADAAIEAEPGILAFQQLAAATSTTVARDDETITVVTLGDDPASLDPLLDQERSTVVIYKGGRKLPEVATLLAKRDRVEGAIAGELLGQPGERCLPLAEMATGPGSYLTTAIVPARRGRRKPG
jgi:precorrin-2/cobalt-factor-2 C20-methyltransferase